MGVIRYLTKAALNAGSLGGYSAGKAGGKLAVKATTTGRCPHCGTRSEKRFAVCPACGREKRR